ncbi:MAG TPA: hypothetical protein VM577_03500 [Anaerovoracaceae bacterium]|nr:hypothetical protein [Anaerovoracaceae bacterium]
MEDEAGNKINTKLEIEYLRNDSIHFRRWFISNEIQEGMKHSLWIGRDYYQIQVDCLSCAVENPRKWLNFSMTLTHIPASQELSDLMIDCHVRIALPRATDNIILTVGQDHFQKARDELLGAYREGRIGIAMSEPIQLADFERVKAYERVYFTL